MTDPLVCCVMLTADRQSLTERAVRCFCRQPYNNKHLLIFDTGIQPFELRDISIGFQPHLVVAKAREFYGQTVGALRNAANALAQGADIIAHFDSDDVSQPNRLEEQVRFLLHNEELARFGHDIGAPPFAEFQGVAYRNLLFWNRERTVTRVDGGEREVTAEPGAWSYNCTFPFPGATFMYRRELWERFPFPDRQTGEDTWWKGRNFLRASRQLAPMVCEIHGGNTSSHVRPDLAEWKREAALDNSTRKILEEA